MTHFSSSAFPLLAVVALATLGATPSRAGLTGSKADVAQAVAVLADLTLIDGQCRDLSVNFGLGFQFGADHGLSVATIMPTGDLRKTFEDTMRLRSAALDHDAICGPLARHYAIELPGSVMFPADVRSSGM